MTAALLLGALLFAGAPAPPVKAASVVRIGILQQANSLNPLIQSEFYENYIDEAIFSGLTVLDDRQRLQPDLAAVVPSRENGGISADGKSITYHLRPGVKWQDGAPFTADDVVFTFAKMRDPSVPYASLSSYRDVIDVRAADPLTVVVRLRRPSAVALIRIFVNGQFGSIVPKHALAGVTGMRTAAFGAKPIGTGPYQLERWDRGSQLVLRANPLYFRGKPAIDELIVKFIADGNSLAIGLRTGEIDISPNLAPSTLPIVRSVARLNLLQVPTIDMLRIEFNTRAAPFGDVRVRRAFAAAIDPALIVQNAYHGAALPADDLLPPSSPFHTRGAFPSTQDMPGAERTLEEAGWKPGAGGVREKSGQKLSVSLLFPTEQAPERASAIALQSMWRTMGADVELRPQPDNTILGPDGTAGRGAFTFMLARNGYDSSPDRGDDLSPKSIPPHGLNFSRYSNMQVERWMEQAEVTLDPAARQALITKISRQVATDRPMAPILWLKFNYAVTKNLINFKPETVNSDLWNVYEWRLQ